MCIVTAGSACRVSRDSDPALGSGAGLEVGVGMTPPCFFFCCSARVCEARSSKLASRSSIVEKTSSTPSSSLPSSFV